MGGRPRHHHGFTLFESLLAIAILGFAVVAVVSAVSSGQQQALASLDTVRAQAVGESLLEEVIALPYAPVSGSNALGPESGETRATFNTADDYHGFSEAAGSLHDWAGNLLPAAYQKFSRAVTCSYATVTVATTGQTVDGLNVSVTVSLNGQAVYTYTRFITQ